MKIAKLPTGKILQFPDETPDDAIDKTVAAHLKEHTEKVRSQEEKEKQFKEDSEKKHGELIQGFSTIAQLLHSIAQGGQSQHKELLGHLSKGHDKITNELVKANNKKKRLVRDKDGRPMGVENV